MLPALIAGGVSLASGLIGGAASARQSQRQAREQMAFQERMSSTSHQREVADLRAAGLNPMLSVNAGASSPGGAMGAVPDYGKAGPEAVHSAMAARRLRADLGLIEGQTASVRMDALVKDAQRRAILADLPRKEVIGDAVTGGRKVIDYLRGVRSSQEPMPTKDFFSARDAQMKRARIIRGGVQRQPSSELPRRPYQSPYRYRGERNDSLPFREVRP